MFNTLGWDQLADCIRDAWSPQIGDPTLVGWVTVASYVVCLVLAILVTRRVTATAERRFWTVLSVILLALAINKQLDLQSALTAAGRCISVAQGWYEDRHSVQRSVILALLAFAGLGLATGLYLMRRHLRRNLLALVGLGLVAGFVAVRAVGFHHIDSLIKDRFLDLRLNALFENSGLLLIALNALLLLRSAYISSRTSVR